MASDAFKLYQELLPLLHGPRKPDRDGRVWSLCPCHPDGTKRNNPSLSLHPRIGLDCFAGCNFTDIVNALKSREAKRPYNPAIRTGTLGKVEPEWVATYTYKTESGIPFVEKRRYQYPDGSKTFLIYLSGSDTAGLKGIQSSEVPIYNLPAIMASPDAPVYVVEGEKAANICIENGLVATTLIQGASSTTFGTALETLTDRKVFLWPDNDPPGREHMTRIGTALKPIAKTIQYVNLPFNLPSKGDAYDYFEMGGTVDDLQGASLQGTKVEVTGEDSVEVKVPYGLHVVTFTFDSISVSRRAFDVRLTVAISGGIGEPYEDDINIQSKSQRTELRRELDVLFGKEWNWVRLVNDACNAARTTYRQIDRSVDAADIIDPQGEHFLVPPLLPLNSPTIFFGDGSSTKSYIEEIMALSFGIGQPFLGKDTPCLPVIYCDWESNESTFKFRMKRIASGLGLDEVPPMAVYYWSGRGLPLSSHLDGLKKLIQETNACLLIIDSIMPACDGEPERADTALRFFNNLTSLKITTLLIAHVTKPPGEDRHENYKRKPFGSTAWHNMARRTWFVERVQETESSTVDVGFYNRKVNDGPRPKDFAVQVVFSDPAGPVIAQEGDITSTPELNQNRSANDQIADYLKRAGLSTIDEIHEATGLKVEIIRSRLSDDKKKKSERRIYFADGHGKIALKE